MLRALSTLLAGADFRVDLALVCSAIPRSGDDLTLVRNEVALVGSTVALGSLGVSSSLAVGFAGFPQIFGEFARLGQALSLIEVLLPFVGESPATHVRDLPFVGCAVAFVGCAVAFVGCAVALISCAVVDRLLRRRPRHHAFTLARGTVETPGNTHVVARARWPIAALRGKARVVGSTERGERREALAAMAAALQRRAAELALEVARSHEELAAALERRAKTSVCRAEDLNRSAAAARRYAEDERVSARRFGTG